MTANVNRIARRGMARRHLVAREVAYGALRASAFGALFVALLGAGTGARAHAPVVHDTTAGLERVYAHGEARSSAVHAEKGAVSRAVHFERGFGRGDSAFLAPSSALKAGHGVRVAQWGAPRGPNPIESFFSTLFGGRQQPKPEPDRTRILITPDASSPPQQSQSPRGGSRAYCVRTCDGRFFPLGARVDRGSYGVGQAQCQSMCPSAEMELYTSSGEIGSAVNSRGRPYTALPAAFLFRRQVVEGCSCNSDGVGGGLQHVDIKDDPTLKAGDVVMTKDGPLVFAGSRRGPPFQDSDFVTPSHFPKMSKEMRQRLKELTLAGW